MSNDTINTQQWKPSKSPWLIAIPTMLAAFMFVLDETIANVALPHMAGTFSSSREESVWILTSYLVASGIIIPAVDFFCKLFGRKNFLIISLIVFTLASVACGFAETLDVMILARIIQGLGGGGLLPIAQAILLESFEPKMRGKAMAMFGIVIILAPIIGPVVGGWITDNWNWPWVFFINLPIGFLTIYLTKILLEDPPYAKKQPNVKIDVLGFSLLTVWLVTLQTVLDNGNNADWFNATWILRLSIVSVIACVLFVFSQIKRKDSLVDLRVFLDRNYSIATFIQVIIQAVLFASLAILPQFLQALMGYDAYLSGLSIMPRGVGALVAIIISGVLSGKIDDRILAAIGLFCMGLAGIELGFLNLDIASINIVIPNFIMGIGLGLAIIPLISLSVSTLRNDQMTNASGLQNLLKNIGGAIGTSLVATFISRFSQIHQHHMIGNLNDLNPVFQAKLASLQGVFAQFTDVFTANHMAQYAIYGQMLEQATLWGFIEAFRIFGIAAFIIIPLLLLLKKVNVKKDTTSFH